MNIIEYLDKSFQGEKVKKIIENDKNFWLALRILFLFEGLFQIKINDNNIYK